MKKIPTGRYYGRDGRILWIYNQPISDEFPHLFAGFWDTYEAWYDHGDRANEGSSSFLLDATLPLAEQHWKRERFGNYLYGSFISVYFSWESLQALKSEYNISDIRGDLAFIRQISGVVMYLFTALDALACCIYIAENRIPAGLLQPQAEPQHLRRLSIKSLRQRIDSPGAYGQLDLLVDRPECKYLSDYRNLLAHRPFPQFQVGPKGSLHFPEDLVQLDSMALHGLVWVAPEIPAG